MLGVKHAKDRLTIVLNAAFQREVLLHYVSVQKELKLIIRAEIVLNVLEIATVAPCLLLIV